MKQYSIADSTIEAKYIAAKEIVWLRNFLMNMGVGPFVQSVITLYSDNSGVVANSKEPRNHKRGKHIERKYHLIWEIVSKGDVKVSHIALEDDLAYPFIKGMTQKTFDRHVEGMGVRCIAA